MKEISKKVLEKEEESISMLVTAISTMENGDKILNTVSVKWYTMAKENIMDIGKMVEDMVKDYSLTQMEIFTLDGGSSERRRELELIFSNLQE